MIIFQESGLPIYSRCYGGFCSSLTVDKTILSGFLAALSSMPSMFGQIDQDLKNVEMGETKLIFSNITGNINVCAGFRKKDSTIEIENHAQKLFSSIDKLMSSQQFKDWDWSIFKKVHKFEKVLVDNVLEPFFHNTNTLIDCPLGNDCTMNVVQNQATQKVPIWSKLKATYAKKI